MMGNCFHFCIDNTIRRQRSKDKVAGRLCEDVCTSVEGIAGSG